MKKFFSLVLALVMALSLTTVAWGATPNVSSLSELTNAINSGTDVDIVLGGNIEITTSLKITAGQTVNLDLNGYTITGPDDGSANWYAFIIKDGTLVLDDTSANQNGQIFAKCYGVAVSGADAAFIMNGGKIDATTNGTLSACVAVFGGYVEINDGEMVSDVWCITAEGSGGNETEVVINDGDFTVENSTQTYATVIQLGGENNTDGATVEINGGTFTGDVIMETPAENTTAGGSVTGEVSGGTFSSDVTTYVAPGNVLVNGEVKSATPAGNTNTYDINDLTITKPDGTKEDTTGLTSIVKVAAVTNTSTVNGKTTTTFVPTWYQVAAGASAGTFVECDKSVATYQFTIKGVGSAYVREMPVPTAFDATPASLYTAPKTATCGKVGANEDTYVVVNGKYYATTGLGTEYYALVNGKMVVYYGTPATAPAHILTGGTIKSYNATTGLATSIECTVCKNPIAVYTKAGSFDGKEYVNTGIAWTYGGNSGTYYYVKGAVAITPAVVTPSTDKVTSADTFDAGIAMYVGMSVMAAAGSVVVLKKRED